MATTKLTIVTPYKNFYEGQINSATIPTLDGDIGFMAGHTPMIIALKPGIAHYIPAEGETRYFTLSEGFCKVDGKSILVVCNSAEYVEDLSPRQTCESYKRANVGLQEAQAIEDKLARDVSLKEVNQALLRAKARRHLLELYGSDHQKERIRILTEEYGWND